MSQQKRLLVEECSSQSAARQQLRRRASAPLAARTWTEAGLLRQIPVLLLPDLEARLRLVVQQGVYEGIQRILQPDPRLLIPTDVECQYELHFNHKLPHTLYTGERIRAEKGDIVQVVLRQAVTKEIIRDGRLSCMTIKISALDGSYDMTTGQFHSRDLVPREGKGPLLRGESKIKLQEGVAYLKDIAFTDNSRWRRSGKFKLGASPSDPGERVREAISDAVVVKHERGKACQKPDAPAFDAEVRCLKNIGNGQYCHRLKVAGIETVLQFRTRFEIDPEGLRKILGTRMNERKWKETVEHALNCKFPQNVEHGTASLSSSPASSSSPQVLMYPLLQTPSIKSAGTHQWNPGAQVNSVHPTAKSNQLLGGPSGENNFWIADDPLLPQLNLQPTQFASMPANGFHANQADHGRKSRASLFVDSSAENHKSPIETDLEALADSFLQLSPDILGKPKRKMWPKVGAVLKWTIKKKVPKKKRWLKVVGVLKLTLKLF